MDIYLPSSRPPKPITELISGRKFRKIGLDLSLEIVKRTREKVGPNYPLLYKISAEEYVKDGVTLEESIIFSEWLEDGVDSIAVSAGTGEVWEHTVAPTHYPYGNLVHLAAEIKNHVSIPIIAVGVINEPELAESILHENKADFYPRCAVLLQLILIGRKKAEAGKAEEIRPCIRCNDCLDSILP